MRYLSCLVLGEKCNWDCNYCDRPRISNPKDVDFNLLKKYYPRILKWLGDTPVHISGGETGLVSQKVLDYIFSFDKKIIVETNGTWFEKGYHKKYKTDRITYHCVKELDEDIKWTLDPQYNVEYLFVVHHLNIHLLDDFLNRNGPRRWLLQMYYPKYLNDHEKYILDIHDYFNLMINYPYLVNRSEIIRRVSPTNIDKLRSECFKKFLFPGFDFVNGRIKFCKQSHSFTDYVDLNEKNFNLLLEGNLKSNKEMDNICKTCIEVVRYIN